MCAKWSNRGRMLVISVVAVAAFLNACSSHEQPAPSRPFRPEDLLVNRDAMPLAWKDVWGPFLPAGDELVTRESAAIQFGVTDDSGPQSYAEHDVYRQFSASVAQRMFEKVYLKKAAYLEPESGWTYRSAVADQEHFGCYEWNGPTGRVCEWAGRYKEYIVVFWTRLAPGGMSLQDVERVVKAIDARMAQYLSKL